MVTATDKSVNRVAEGVIINDKIAIVHDRRDLDGRTHIAEVHQGTVVPHHEETEVHDTVLVRLGEEEAQEDVLEAQRDQCEMIRKARDEGAPPTVDHQHENEKMFSPARCIIKYGMSDVTMYLDCKK